jgi:hypothetical protein
MAKIVITIEDAPDGRVKMVSDPSFETMMKMDLSGEKMTPAIGYAFCAINAIRKASKKIGPLVREVPKLWTPPGRKF